MTEPAPLEQYHVFSRESHLQAHIVKRLRTAGWLVIVTSQDRRTRRQLAGLPDLLCFHNNMVALIEVKQPGGEMTPAEVEFMEKIMPYLDTQLMYFVMRYPGDADKLCGGVE